MVVADDLAGHKLPEPIPHRALVLDLQREIVEVFLVLSEVATVLAPHHRAGLASEHILEQVLLAGAAQQGFKPVESKVEEFLGVLLLPDVGRLALEGLEAEAEGCWVVVLAV